MRAALYARTSTTEQHPEAQLHALRAYAQARGLEVTEHVDDGVSGAKAKRPALDALLEQVHRREVDLIVVTKLDRLARSVSHLVQLAQDFEARDCHLVVLDQAIDTTTPTGRLTFHVLAAMAQFERDLIRERTMAGLAAAKRRGKRLGRPPVLDKRGLQRARRMAKAGCSTRHIGKMLGISQSAAHRALKS